MITFSVIAAVDKDFGIGKGGQLPWHLSGDLKHFSRVTTGGPSEGLPNAVIMGRKTWDSLPSAYKPLPGRINIVLSRNKEISLPEGVRRAGDLDHALDSLMRGKNAEAGEVFVIGGAAVFQEAVRHPRCRKIFLTHILNEFSCDTFFPRDLSGYRTVSKSETHREGSTEFYFSEYERDVSPSIS